jgi:hypothetical protein
MDSGVWVAYHDASSPNDASSPPPTCSSQDGGCNTLMNCGKKVTVNWADLDAPAPKGGAVAPGTYSMTDFTEYLGTSGSGGRTSPWFRETMVLSTGVADAGAPSDGGSPDGDAGQQADADAGGASDAAPSAQNLQWSDISESSSQSTTAATGVLSLDGTTAAIEYACPSMSPFSAGYSADPATLVFFVESPGVGTGMITYKKQ